MQTEENDKTAVPNVAATSEILNVQEPSPDILDLDPDIVESKTVNMTATATVVVPAVPNTTAATTKTEQPTLTNKTHSGKDNQNADGEVNGLKVKADPEDIAPEDRKKAVKKLAGAISHSLRAEGEVNIRCFGSAAIGKAAKAIAIAKDYIASQNLKLFCSPAFITTKIGDNNLTGICFYTFTSEKTDADNIDVNKCKSVLLVKSDAKEATPDERKTSVKKLAGAISHSLEENKECVLRCFGNATIGKATKALAIARGYTATRGPDLYAWPMFIVAKMNDNERTGIAFYVFTNES